MTEENPETQPEKQSNASEEEQIHPEQNENQEEDIEEKKISGFVKKNWLSTMRCIRNSWANFVDDVKHPRKAMSDLVKSKSFIINSLAIVVGVIGALTAWGFEWLYVGADFLFMEIISTNA